MSEADEILTIDVVSDVVCPWCYLGEKRLEAALAEEFAPRRVTLAALSARPDDSRRRARPQRVHGEEIRQERQAAIRA